MYITALADGLMYPPCQAKNNALLLTTTQHTMIISIKIYVLLLLFLVEKLFYEMEYYCPWQPNRETTRHGKHMTKDRRDPIEFKFLPS